MECAKFTCYPCLFPPLSLFFFFFLSRHREGRRIDSRLDSPRWSIVLFCLLASSRRSREPFLRKLRRKRGISFRHKSRWWIMSVIVRPWNNNPPHYTWELLMPDHLNDAVSLSFQVCVYMNRMSFRDLVTSLLDFIFLPDYLISSFARLKKLAGVVAIERGFDCIRDA